MALCSY
jgi:hypothetical protein